jgi:hypothetical protein
MSYGLFQKENTYVQKRTSEEFIAAYTGYSLWISIVQRAMSYHILSKRYGIKDCMKLNLKRRYYHNTHSNGCVPSRK